MIDNACCQNSRVARSVRKHGSEENMRAKTERRSLGVRGDPEFGSWRAYASIPVIDDEGTSSPTRTGHQADPRTGRYGCKHRALCRPAPHMALGFACWCTPIAAGRIAAFRHSVGGFARRAPRAAAIVRALGNAANDNWEFGPRYFSEAAHASLRGAG